MALLLSALAVGCGGGGGGQDTILGGGGAAGLAPTVTATFPIINATGVPINTKIITATFTKAMDPATLNTASFTLTCPAGTPQTGAVGYVTSGAVATLTLAVTNTLPVNTICTATVTTAAKDTSGISLASNFIWTFTTGLAPDTTAPTVTGTIHTNGQTNVAINTKVGATFSEAMDPLTITASTFTLKQGATTVSGTVTYAGVNAVFTPASNLAPSTTYTVTVTTGAKDVRGNPLASDFVISWTTGAAPDTTAPTVTGTVYPNGATNVPVNTKISPTFSEGMDPLTITNVNLTMKNTATGAAVAGTTSYSGVSAVFIPLNNLAFSTGYTMTVTGGTSGVKDLAGNPLASDFVWSWTTGAAPDTTAPTVTGTINVNGATNVAINTKVGATFSEGMDPLTITNLNFALRNTATGTAVAGIVSYSGVSAVFIPTSTLANSTNYTVTVKGGVSGVKDLAGNPMTSDFVISWTTGAAPDTTAPTVTGTIHTNGQTNVNINTKVGATFSEGMDPLTITNLNFTMKNTATSAAVAGTTSYSGVSAVFIPASALANSTNYTITVKGGTSGVKDLAGNPMTNDFVISWTTGAAPDLTAPRVIATINANGETNVVVNTKVGASFSEGMNPLTITNLNFALRETVSGNAVAGTLGYTGVNAVFIPTSNLAGNTGYTATAKGGLTGVADLAGNPMASDYVWSWTTGAAPDTTGPTITIVNPANLYSGYPPQNPVNATFSEALDPLTVTTANFTLMQGTTPVTGTVTYSLPLRLATFKPNGSLAYATTYTAQVSTGVKDIAGNALASGLLPNPWSFTTAPTPTAGTTTTTVPGATTTTTVSGTTTTTLAGTGVCIGSGCVNLASAANYVILAQSGVSTVPSSVVTGNVGVSPAARGFLTGWSLIAADVTDTAYLSAQVTGNLYAADMVGGTTSSDLSTAVGHMGTAYTTAGGMAKSGGALPAGGPQECPGVGAMSNVNNNAALGGSFPLAGLPAGVYTCAVDVTIPGTLTLKGTATDVWVFRITGKLTQATGISVLLDGALAENVFWVVSGVVDIGTNAHMEGVILAQTNINLRTGASINGRLLAQTAVTIDQSTVTKP